MKLIYLNTGAPVQVDDADFIWLSRYKWYEKASAYNSYACRCQTKDGKRITLRMHREIMQCPAGMETDHKDTNPFNNQRSNLENVTKSENIFREQRPLFRPNNHNGLTQTK